MIIKQSFNILHTAPEQLTSHANTIPRNHTNFCWQMLIKINFRNKHTEDYDLNSISTDILLICLI